MPEETYITLADGPVLTTVFITPQMAVEFLEKNTSNRKVRTNHVKELSRDITNGHWDLNGEAIKISKRGEILDGQHRLHAILVAGVGIWTVLITNLADETRFTLDTNLRRTPTDHFRIAGVKSASNVAPLLGAVWQYLNGRAFTNHNRATQRDRQALLDQYPGLHRSADIGYRVYLGFRPFNRTAVGVAHFAISQVDTEVSPEFFARLEDGANLDTGNPVLTLRRRVMADREDNLRYSLSDQVGYIIYTWNHWLNYTEAGKPLYRMIFPAGSVIPEVNKPRQARQEELTND